MQNCRMLLFYESESNFICNSIIVGIGTYINNIKISTDISVIHLAFSFCSVIKYKH